MLQLVRPKHRLRRSLIVLAVLIVLVAVLPYAFQLSSADPVQAGAPYKNSSFADVDGVRLHYRLWQTDDLPVKGQVLLIHGLGGSTYSWEMTAPALLEAGYRVVAVDLPVFGFSSRQPGLDHSQRNRARLLWLLLDQIGTREEPVEQKAGWILAGHSMGAGTAAAMAMARPDQTRQLIVIDGALSDRRSGIVSLLLAIPPVRRWLALALEHVLISRSTVENLLTTTHGQIPSAERLDAYLIPLQLPGTASALVDFTQTARSEAIENLNRLDTPIKAVWGANDTITPLSEAERLVAIVPATRLWLIPGAGHLPMETHAAAFNRLLIQILEESAK